ncbi:MAG: ACP S-malonyltransferase [Candidatus Methylomirabilales bacterium]
MGDGLGLVFPGQGSQYVGMGSDLSSAFPEVGRLFNEAAAVTGVDLRRLCMEGPAAELQMTVNTQPAILTVSTMVWALLTARGVKPDLVAGHSLGEYSALVAAEAISFRDAIRVVRRRAELMQGAAEVGVGAMAAVVGLSLEDIARVCEDTAGDGVLEVANVNCPGQVVIAGHTEAIERASILAKQRGAKRVQPLPVSGPFHCRLMAPATKELASLLDQVDIRDPMVPVVANVDADLKRDRASVVAALVRQLSAPVRWEAVIRRMVAEGVRTFIEVGPGRVLSGLIKRIDDTVRIGWVEDGKSLTEALTLVETV